MELVLKPILENLTKLNAFTFCGQCGTEMAPQMNEILIAMKDPLKNWV